MSAWLGLGVRLHQSGLTADLNFGVLKDSLLNFILASNYSDSIASELLAGGNLTLLVKMMFKTLA